MASGQTANYQLNQWEAEDKVLRTEFNADNAKLDAALAELAAEVEGAVQANPYQKLAHVAVTQAADTVTLDLSGVDWNQWSIVAAVADPINHLADNTSFTVNGPNIAVQREISGEITPAFGPHLFVFFPMRNAQRLVRYLAFPGGQLAGSAQGTYSAITGITLGTNSSHGLKVGSRITVYGIR